MKSGLTLLLVLVLASVFFSVSPADILVGVKQGDWIEYNVSFTGNPPIEHDAVWARMEIISVDGKKVNASFVSRLANETVLEILEDLDLEKGRLIDMFIIPAYLDEGDVFYDQISGQIVIDRVETRNYAGADRTVVYAEAVDTQWYWDRATGVTVEARTSNSMYTLDTVATGTDMWNSQIFGLDANIFYGLLSLIAVGVGASIILSLQRRKRRLTSPQT
jgi:hypothetical protein